jgi:hypothetical protein
MLYPIHPYGSYIRYIDRILWNKIITIRPRLANSVIRQHNLFKQNAFSNKHIHVKELDRFNKNNNNNVTIFTEINIKYKRSKLINAYVMDT